MRPEIAINVQNVSKKFARSLPRMMIYGMQEILQTAFMPRRYRSQSFDTRIGEALEAGKAIPPASVLPLPPLRPTEFWAVKNVSFTLLRGECLGIVGHNGAGKSTLFKMLSGIFSPTHGRIEQYGSLSALIEVGAGFHPMLTGRENIYIAGAIRGMSTAEIDRKFESIIEFSGVREFIDSPIKFYSSGMHVRLGFAVLAHLEPDILLIDEILAVGDMAFQKQCIDHINKLRESNMALALVSHNLYRIEALCSHSIWLDHGELKLAGATPDVIAAYRESVMKAERDTDLVHGKGASAQGTVHLKHVVTYRDDGIPTSDFAYGEPINVRVEFHSREKVERPIFQLFFYNGATAVFIASMLIDGDCPDYISGDGEITCRIGHPQLLPRNYNIMLYIREKSGSAELIDPGYRASISITSAGLDRIPGAGICKQSLLMQGGLVHQDYQWNHGKAHC